MEIHPTQTQFRCEKEIGSSKAWPDELEGKRNEECSSFITSCSVASSSVCRKSIQLQHKALLFLHVFLLSSFLLRLSFRYSHYSLGCSFIHATRTHSSSSRTSACNHCRESWFEVAYSVSLSRWVVAKQKKSDLRAKYVRDHINYNNNKLQLGHYIILGNV